MKCANKKTCNQDLTGKITFQGKDGNTYCCAGCAKTNGTTILQPARGLGGKVSKASTK